jgi:hypothetical protein
MEIAELENKLKKLAKDINKESFIYDFLEAYDFPKATISRLRSGDLNVSKNLNEIFLKKKLLFKAIYDQDLHDVIDDLSNNAEIKRHDPRFIIVTNFEILLTLDTKSRDTLDIEIQDIYKHYDFFLPWVGREKTNLQNENIADVKAATKMSQLYDLILQDNPDFLANNEKKHCLNIFFARLLFCLFAEDTNIFEVNIFTNYLATHSNEDGSDLGQRLEDLFVKLNTKETVNYSKSLERFPYVNGGLFDSKIFIPNFSRKSRTIILEAGQLDWGAINPDIFGSMVQAIADPEERSDFGVHYTSVTNILKVIKPLFLDELYESFNSFKSEKDLERLLSQIYSFTIFDPACGSGNFLIVSYKELCIIEIKIFEELIKLNPSKWSIARSGLRLNQFCGITLKDFDVQIARLSLWLTEHQMNLSFEKVFGSTKPTLPLTEHGNIHQGNATRMQWKSIFGEKKEAGILIIGNPPYISGKAQSDEQKEDMAFVFNEIKNYKELDYISCWFYKAAKFIELNKKSKFAFVTTNTLCQGAQVEQLWPKIISNDREIYFSYSPFDWTNNAKNKAGVVCTIIGIRNKSDVSKYIYTGTEKILASNINAYLLNFRDIYVKKKTASISNFPAMITGNSAYDGKNLMISADERKLILSEYPEASKLIRKVIGSEELIDNIERYCLWIADNQLSFAEKIPPIKKRISLVSEFRKNGGDVAKSLINKPHQFRYLHEGFKNSLIIPIVSSCRRKYIPIGFVPGDVIVLSSAAVIYNAETFIMGILSSYMHNLWVRVIAGRLGWSIRYLSALCYNTFPFPIISEDDRKSIEGFVFKILDERERFSEKTLADLYDTEKMPDQLRSIHNDLDRFIESLFSQKPFKNDEERLEAMFTMYEKIIYKDTLI